MIAPIDGFPMPYERLLELTHKLRLQIEADLLKLDPAQLRKLDAAAMSLLVTINMKRQRPLTPTTETKPLPDHN